MGRDHGVREAGPHLRLAQAPQELNRALSMATLAQTQSAKNDYIPDADEGSSHRHC